MRKMNFGHVLILVAILVIGIITTLNAKPTMAIDSNGYPLQFGRSFTCSSDSVEKFNSYTTWDSVAVASNAVMVTICATDTVFIRPGGTSSYALKVATPSQATGVQIIPKNMPVTIPVQNVSYIAYHRKRLPCLITFSWHKM